MFVPICATPLKPGFNRNSGHFPLEALGMNGRFDPIIRPPSQYCLNYNYNNYNCGYAPTGYSQNANPQNVNAHNVSGSGSGFGSRPGAVSVSSAGPGAGHGMAYGNSVVSGSGTRVFGSTGSNSGSGMVLSTSMGLPFSGQYRHSNSHSGGVGVGSVNYQMTSAVGSPEIMTANGADGDLPDGSNRTVPFELLQYRKPAMFVAIMDCIFATSLLVFHGLTLMVQEIPVEAEENNWLLPRIPMTPGMLTITGYMEVIAWIAILGVNAIQLLVGVGLFNSCDKKREALKAFEASRLWIKTCCFIVIILIIKLCILYFMYRMDMSAFGTVAFTVLETLFHAVGIIVVFKFFGEIKENNPVIAEIYLMPDEDASPKRQNNVADAVWF